MEKKKKKKTISVRKPSARVPDAPFLIVSKSEKKNYNFYTEVIRTH